MPQSTRYCSGRWHRGGHVRLVPASLDPRLVPNASRLRQRHRGTLGQYGSRPAGPIMASRLSSAPMRRHVTLARSHPAHSENRSAVLPRRARSPHVWVPPSGEARQLDARHLATRGGGKRPRPLDATTPESFSASELGDRAIKENPGGDAVPIGVDGNCDRRSPAGRYDE